MCGISLKFPQWFMVFAHLRSSNKHNQTQKFLPEAVDNNLYSYDFVFN